MYKFNDKNQIDRKLLYHLNYTTQPNIAIYKLFKNYFCVFISRYVYQTRRSLYMSVDIANLQVILVL